MDKKKLWEFDSFNFFVLTANRIPKSSKILRSRNLNSSFDSEHVFVPSVETKVA